MGSDLSMSPPSVDERRVVTNGTQAAIYSRHTDGIYGDITTWTRRSKVFAANGDVIEALRAGNSMATTTVNAHMALTETLPSLDAPDRDLEAEIRVARSKLSSATDRERAFAEEARKAGQELDELLALAGLASGDQGLTYAKVLT